MTEPVHRNVFRYRPFAILWCARFLTMLAIMTQSITFGWQVYAIARQELSIEKSAFLVGMIGLAQFLPMFLLTLLAGETADRYDRRKIMVIGCIIEFFCAGFLCLADFNSMEGLWTIFAVAALSGAVRVFKMAAGGALAPMLVPRAALPRAVAMNTLSIQGGMIVGPWLGGMLCAISVSVSYGAAAVFFGLAACVLTMIRGNTKPQHKSGKRRDMIREGLIYVWSNKIVFGAISLDLFAVLLGGVTALLPVFARDILHVEADGFGILRAGVGSGGGLMTLILSQWPIQRRAGRTMFLGVAIFGFATIIFALSRDLWLSVAALALLGAADSISVNVRQSLVQIVTPDHMRGRVSAVSSLFIGASNELGEFESGVAARLLGPIGAAIFGGVGAIGVTALWTRLFPALYKTDRLIEPDQ